MTETYYINVDIYNDDNLFNKRLSELSMFRRNKTLRYRYRKDQNLSIGVGMLLDHCLGKLGIREKHVNYVLGENGKPAFECNDDNVYTLRNIHFNVSHSGNMAICSWGTDPVGVDIEQIDYKQAESIPYNMLASEEVKYLLALPRTLSICYRITQQQPCLRTLSSWHFLSRRIRTVPRWQRLSVYLRHSLGS